MRMASMVVVSALSAAACARSGPRVQPSPVSSSGAMSYSDGSAQQGFADANGPSEFEYRRVHAAAGRFITATVLNANGDRPLEDVLRVHLLGFERNGESRPSRPSGECGLDVWVNGLPTISFDGIRPRDLLGVEYYEAGTVPVKYRRPFSTCPVLLLWLKPR